MQALITEGGLGEHTTQYILLLLYIFDIFHKKNVGKIKLAHQKFGENES